VIIDISTRINLVKKEFMLKNVDLANIAGISKQAVGGWINENKTPSREVADTLQEKLGVSQKWLRLGIGNMLFSKSFDVEKLLLIFETHLDNASTKEQTNIAGKLIKMSAKYL